MPTINCRYQYEVHKNAVIQKRICTEKPVLDLNRKVLKVGILCRSGKLEPIQGWLSTDSPVYAPDNLMLIRSIKYIVEQAKPFCNKSENAKIEIVKAKGL